MNLTEPVTRIGFGPLSFRPLEKMIDAKLSDLLGPLLVGPVTRRPSATGLAVGVYPAAMPEGENAIIPCAQGGEVGSHDDCGRLTLNVVGMAGWLGQRLDAAVVRALEDGASLDGSARVAKVRVRRGPDAGERAGSVHDQRDRSPLQSVGGPPE